MVLCNLSMSFFFFLVFFPSSLTYSISPPVEMCCERAIADMLRGHVQVLLNKLRGFSAQACLDAPRFCISAGLPESGAAQASSAGNMDSEIYFEEGISEQVIEDLRSEFLLLSSLFSLLCFLLDPLFLILSPLSVAQEDISIVRKRSSLQNRYGPHMRNRNKLQTRNIRKRSINPTNNRSIREESMGMWFRPKRRWSCNGTNLGCTSYLSK